MSVRLANVCRLAAATALICMPMLAGAAQVNLTITAENLAPTNSISFAPLHFGVHSNTFDAFNLGQVATNAIISVAEGGGGQAWQAAFAAADPAATRGTVGMPLFPGMSRSLTVTVDTSINQYFTFASMVVPSNDFFIGNDSAILDQPEGQADLGCRFRAARSGGRGFRGRRQQRSAHAARVGGGVQLR